MRNKVLHFIDTETTGLDCIKHEIIEIAIISEFGDGRVEEWSTKIKPVRLLDADPKALQVNGYNDADWADAPLLPEVIETIREKLKDGIVVGHNVPFDVSFIREAYKRCGFDIWSKASRVGRYQVDTMTLAHEHLHPMGITSLSFDAIRTFCGWSKAGAHTALKDAEDCRRLYWALLRWHSTRRS